MITYLLWHETPTAPNADDREWEVTLIGCFSSRRRALDEWAFAALLPKFEQWQDGFTLDEYDIDELQWRQGFVTDDA